MGSKRTSSADASNFVEVIVDTPKGSRNKYKFDERRGVYMLHKVLPMGAAFPFDFGFIPDTDGDDGDALDVVVLGEEPTFTGCLITVRLLGVILAEQTEKGQTIRNDRLVATPETPKIHPVERSLADLPAKLLDQIEHFFAAYNRAEGREFVSIGRRGPRVAARLVAEGRSRRRRVAGHNGSDGSGGTRREQSGRPETKVVAPGGRASRRRS